MVRAADHLALLTFFCWAAVYGTRRLAGADYWWHMAFGRYLWEHRAFPKVDVFTFTAHGEPWVNVSWLADLLLYAVHSVAGIAGLGALTTLLILGATLAAAWASHRAGRSAVFISVAALALSLHWPRFILRPFLMSSVFTALAVGLIEHDRLRWRVALARSSTASPGGTSYVWLVVPLAWVWACVHGAFPVVFGLVGAYGIEVLLQRPSQLRDEAVHGQWRRRFLALIGLGVSCVAVTLAQPYGIYAYGRIGQMMGSGVWHTTIGEWQHMWDYAARSGELALRWYGFCAIVAVSFLVALPRFSLFRVFAVVGTGVLAFDAIRHLDVFLYVATPVAVGNLHDALDGHSSVLARLRLRRWRPHLQVTWSLFVLLAVGRAAFAYTSGRLLVGDRIEWARAWDVGPVAYPEAPVAHLAKNPTGGHIFNAFEHGGYISWRLYPEPVFIDSKGLDEAQFLAYVDALHSHVAFTRAVERYDLRAVVMTLSPRWGELYVRLVQDPTWHLEVLDETGFLFTRRDGGPIRSPALSVEYPGADLPSFTPAPLPPVDGARIRNAPLPVAARQLGDFWLALDMPRRAIAAFGGGIQTSPNSLPIRLDYAEAALRLDRPELALDTLQTLPANAPRGVQARAHLMRARIALARGDVPHAIAYAEAAGENAGEAAFQLQVHGHTQLGNLGDAAVVGERWVRRYPHSTSARNDLAIVRAMQDDTNRALELINAAIADAPDDGRLFRTRGMIWERRGETARARQDFSTADRLSGEHAAP